MIAIDRRHKGETEATFSRHYRIYKDTDPDKSWTLLLHVRMARWRWLGSYETQQEAILAMDRQ